MFALRSCAIVTLLSSSLAQVSPAEPFFTGFNSSFSLSPAQIEAATLTNITAASINSIINFDRSSLAYGGPRQDEFCQLPNLSSEAISALIPGSLLKVQDLTDTAPFAIAPGASLSRILYTTLNFNGSVVPASAYVLWPYEPRLYDNQSERMNSKAVTILWAHGTSGYFADAAPSSDRALYYGDIMPLSLVQAGYVVVAPDYAGLGVGSSWNGSEIVHQYFAMPAGAKDALFAMKVALDTFQSRLSGRFAIVGHSQGGGVAWSAAELLVSTADSTDSEESFDALRRGYVGTVALAAVTKTLFANGGAFLPVLTAMSVQSVFPDFALDTWLQPLAIARLQLLREIQGGAIVGQQLFLSGAIDSFLKESWYNSTYHGAAFEQLMNVGQRPFAGPLMVVQDTEDVFVPPAVTSAVVAQRCAEDPNIQLEYVIANGVRHTSVIAATRSRWMSWLDDRFSGRHIEPGCVYTNISGWLGPGSTSNGYLQWAGAPEYTYQNPAAN